MRAQVFNTFRSRLQNYMGKKEKKTLCLLLVFCQYFIYFNVKSQIPNHANGKNVYHTSSLHHGARIIFFSLRAAINSSHVFTTLMQASLFCFAASNKLSWMLDNISFTCPTKLLIGISTLAELSRRTTRTCIKIQFFSFLYSIYLGHINLYI